MAATLDDFPTELIDAKNLDIYRGVQIENKRAQPITLRIMSATYILRLDTLDDMLKPSWFQFMDRKPL
jgi:ferredoxin-fold anticodon binding domain-containing protein